MNPEIASSEARCRRRPRLAVALLALGAAAPLPGQFGAIGLCGVGGQRFGNEDLLFFEPQADDHFARVLAAGDFNGDGADDLATGMPHDNGIVGFEIDDCGGVVIRYGVPGGGLEPGLADTLLNQIVGGSPDPAEAGDNFGGALAACDFNADGFDDLAVGIPNEDVGGRPNVGAVQIYYGSAVGLGTQGEFLTQDSPGVPGEAEFEDLFGFSLACGDFNADGHADLAIGSPWEWFEDDSLERAGVVFTIDGSPAGLDTATADAVFQETPGIGGTAESEDWFGWALAAGNFDSDEADDLAVGVPGEDGPDFGQGRGAVHVVFGDGVLGLPFGAVLLTEDDFGGNPEVGDQLGYALAAGDFDGDQFTDIAVGVPFEDVFGAVDGGQVLALYGRPCCPVFVGEFWSENVIHGAGTTETGDAFGFSLAGGDFDRDGRDDLAIGHPGEFVLVPQDGQVTVVMGSASGIDASRRIGLAAGFHGNPGVQNQANRNYGHAVATGDFDGDGYADLAIGAPNEDEGGIANVGAEVVLYGSLFCDGLEVGNTGFWSSTVP